MEKNNAHILSSNIANKIHWSKIRINMYFIAHVFIYLLSYKTDDYTAGDYMAGSYTAGCYTVVK